MKPLRILRDTGAFQSLILAEAIPLSESSSSGKSVLTQGVECGLVTVPLHEVNLQSDLVSGNCGFSTSIANRGHALNIRQDLAGDKVNPVMTEKHEVTATVDPVEEEIPHLYCSCAVTRAIARKATLEKCPGEKKHKILTTYII